MTAQKTSEDTPSTTTIYNANGTIFSKAIDSMSGIASSEENGTYVSHFVTAGQAVLTLIPDEIKQYFSKYPSASASVYTTNPASVTTLNGMTMVPICLANGCNQTTGFLKLSPQSSLGSSLVNYTGSASISSTASAASTDIAYLKSFVMSVKNGNIQNEIETVITNRRFTSFGISGQSLQTPFTFLLLTSDFPADAKPISIA